MSYMFNNCASLTELNLSGCDTYRVTNMEHMFSSCTKLNKLDLTSFDTYSCKVFDGIFEKCGEIEVTLNRNRCSSLLSSGQVGSNIQIKEVN